MYTFAYTDMSRKVPTNYVLLLIFTITEAYAASYIGLIYKPKLILLAAFLTLMMTAGLTLYACRTETDVTQYGSLIYMIVFILLGIGLT